MKHRRKAGFSLIEVLFAIFLVFACAMIVAATMPISDQARGKADLLSRATGLAQKQLEAIRAVGYQNTTPTQLASLGLIDSSTSIGTNTYSFTNSDSTNLDNPGLVLPNGNGQINLTQISTGLLQVTVTVSYQDSQRSRTLHVGTVIANLAQ
jgi:type II secretory pathway pseudopilin PulG